MSEQAMMQGAKTPPDIHQDSLKTGVLGLVFLGGLWLLFTSIKSAANFYDEGLVLVNAERILHGAVPYRDYWTLYAPGYFYLLAALFKVFGPSMLLARFFDTLLRFGLTIAVYVLARRMTSRWVALVPYLLVTLWLSAIRFYSYPAFPTTACILLAALALYRYLDTRRRRWLFVTGLITGVTALMRLDFGGYTAVAAATAAGIFRLRQASRDRQGAGPALLAVVKDEALLAAGAALVALPAYGALAAAAGLDTLWSDLIVFPATTFRAMRHLPVPGLIPDLGHLISERTEDWLRLYLPLAVYLAAAVFALRRLLAARHEESGQDTPLYIELVFLIVVGVGLVVKATSRYHELHALPTAICAAIVAAALCYQIPRRLWKNALFDLGFIGMTALLITAPYILHFTAMFDGMARLKPEGCYSQLARADCVPIGEDEQMAVQYIQSHTGPDDYVFVGNSKHDMIFVNDILFYFLAGRPIPTRYTELHPGLATTLPVQQAIAQELAGKDVKWVVTANIWDSNEPNASSISSGINYLDDYIRTHYRSVTTLGNYRIWTKRN